MLNARPVLFVVAVLSVFATAVITPVHVRAQSAQPDPGYGTDNPKELFEGATRMAMKALELLIKTLPQYDPPVVLKNGDILIKRKRPNDEQGQPDGDANPDEHRI